MAVNLDPVGHIDVVDGVRLATAAASIRYQGRDDLLLIALEAGASVALVQTRNRFRAAPVQVAEDHVQHAEPMALLVNAGNANAGTGQTGVNAARQSCEAVAKSLGLEKEQVLPFSTGVIGEPLPVQLIEQVVPDLVEQLDADSWVSAAGAIMTTDTVAKGHSVKVNIDGVPVTISGICKGSGMIHPNMATMLAFIATDAPVDKAYLDQCVHEAAGISFNCVTVDGDTSTNDACVVIATGKAPIAELNEDNDHSKVFRRALEDLMVRLAQDIARDAEGASKFVQIQVHGDDAGICKTIANTIALSPLVKTALFASDPNWGRILAAIGRAPVPDKDIDMTGVSFSVNDVAVVTDGEVDPGYSEQQGQAAFREEELFIDVRISDGAASATVWTSDLSHDYVSINADYRS